MALDIIGKLHKIFDVEQKTESFKAREFVIETSGEYPQFVKFQATQERCAMVESFKEGEMIKVHFDLRGREWQGKYFTNINAWKIEAALGATESSPAQEYSAPKASQAVSSPSTQNIDAREDLDDLPF